MVLPAENPMEPGASCNNKKDLNEEEQGLRHIELKEFKDSTKYEIDIDNIIQ